MQPDDLLTTADVAQRLDVHEVTVRKWRCDGTGPPYTRLGGCVRYLRRDVEAWIEENVYPCRISG